MAVNPPPLDGLRAVLVSPTRTALQTGQFLADFGAEVVIVEPPGGSRLRDEAAWPFWARGTTSIELDLHDAADHEIALGLAVGSDVVVESFRPGVSDALGLGHTALAARNPRVITCSITGFGRTGPYADLQGYEGVVMAKTGVLWHVAGLAGGGRPAFPAALYGSFPATQLALQGILAALVEREDSGRGQHVETSIAQGITVHDTFGWFARVVAARFPDSFRQTPIARDGVPAGDLSFRLLIALTADGHWLQFSQVVDRLFRAMMRVLELDWMLEDPEWTGAPAFEDAAKREAFWEHLLRAVKAHPLAEWQRRFDENPDVWAETFRQGDEVLDHPQTRWNGMVTEIEDPVLGPVLQPAAVVRMDGTPARLGRSAPRRGAHDEVLRRRVAPPGPAPTPAADLGSAAPTRPPLAGVTVLELGTYYAAPFGATLLADYGARVIKIEEPAGDPMRNMLPFPDVAGIKALVGKESIAVDIHTEEGREVVRDLAARADVVLQSFRAGVAERLGLDAVSLRAVNPDLVYLTAPGYGVDGPCGHRPAYAPTIGAGAGLAYRNAGAGSAIQASADMGIDEIKQVWNRLVYAVMGVGNADGYAAVTVGTALVLGILARKRGHGGQTMLTTMLSTATHALSEETVRYADRGPAPTADPELYGLGALYRLYQAADGWVFLAAPEQHEWERLATVMPGTWSTDSRLTTADGRREHDAELASALAEWFRQRTAAEWEAELRAADVACVEVVPGPVEGGYLDEGSVGQVSGFVTTCRHGFLGEIPRLAPLVRFSRSATVAGDACAVGEHTLSILGELGYSRRRVEQLLASAVVAAD
ncbi:CaiB/BaiF CoA transferase family protein [Pseudonocardia kunmingensis]|uniref:Dimethylsulfoniopropionate cleavage enzyme DddD n=1 Tax=Pseudonocardia kunmingensis TaxID=630975 RepID=A0A543DPD2_9PSEU|nr:CoA transferase [Pseudonocardia kunmingensis]TQM11194.1 dimethylsulfoniopropionate cleavage enzyme DddD [Pseudonocardia kunmingensis]